MTKRELRETPLWPQFVARREALKAAGHSPQEANTIALAEFDEIEEPEMTPADWKAIEIGLAQRPRREIRPDFNESELYRLAASPRGMERAS
ncbi:MAG TPA: hypothetical protein VKX17_03395 [Planctomycetota bacterium]|nr:hypothetical protein [Planctomycetota bacterium]